MQAIKYKHALYWFSNLWDTLWNFEKTKTIMQLQGKTTNGRMISIKRTGCVGSVGSNPDCHIGLSHLADLARRSYTGAQIGLF